MPTKNKKTQEKTPYVPHGRDLFQTPAYAVNLLLPFIPKNIETIWEPACGDFKISKVLEKAGYEVIKEDLKYGQNFLFDEKYIFSPETTMIITNPPFSLKKEFFEKCLYYKIVWALLIPTDYCKWVINGIWHNGVEKIVPDNRISYITPNTIKRINIRHSENYENITQVPQEYLVEDFAKSSAQFHSMWYTWGLGLGKSETFTPLTKEMKKDI
jgi:hypothetical protein